MFEGLDEQMKHDDLEETTPKARWMKWITIGVVAVVIFAGLYFGLAALLALGMEMELAMMGPK